MKKELSNDVKYALAKFSVHKTHGDNDVYICKCGYTNIFEPDKNLEIQEREIYEYEDLNLMVNMAEGDHICENCGGDFKIDAINSKLIQSGDIFTGSFKSTETEKNISIMYSDLRVDIIPGEDSYEFQEKSIDRSFTIDKESKQIFYSDQYEVMHEIDLDDVVKYVDKFFDSKIKLLGGMFDLHIFTQSISTIVSDAKNINIFSEMLSLIKGRAEVGDATNVFKKIFTVFFSIIKYSNLSTIGMTKGSNFMYDLITGCNLPKPTVLIENKVTSPIKIFNFLIKNYMVELSDDVNADNKKFHEFTYKSSKLKVLNIDNINKNQISVKDGKIDILGVNSDHSVSKILYKKINKFSEYKKLIQYLKFISYDELTILLQRYEVEFLVEFIDLVYFRNNTDYSKIQKIIPLVQSFCQAKMNELNVKVSEKELNSFVKEFTFTEYDDAIKMLKMLENTVEPTDEVGLSVTRKALKEFNKIKDYSSLIKFHNELNTYFKGVADPKKNGAFREFASKFKHLEAYDDAYHGPLEVQIIATPDGVIKEGYEMSHSAPAYIDAVVERRYLMCKVYDRSEDVEKGEITRFTMGLDCSQFDGLVFDQIKGAFNKQGSDRFKKLVMQYLEAKDISYQPVRDLRMLEI